MKALKGCQAFSLFLPPAARGALFVILKRTVIGHWSFVIGEINNTKKQTLIGRGCQPPAPWTPSKSFLLRLKASIPFLYTNSNILNNLRHIAAFSAGSVQLKKPSVGPKGLTGPPCHGVISLKSILLCRQSQRGKRFLIL
jgi:hypothetical protein